MRPFRFKLDPVRRLRQAERDELRGRLSDAYRAAEVLQQQREDVQRELGEIRSDQQSAASQKTINVTSLIDSQRYEMVLRGQESALAEKLKLVEMEIAKRRDAVAQAERRVKTLDKLENKQADAHRVADQRALAKLTDEAALAGHARKSAGASERLGS